MPPSRTVAVVEDEAAIRENYAAALRRQGYRVNGYASRTEALSAFESRLPDLVIIDINLAGEAEGGFELCRQLRARSAELPIIFLTARETEIDAVSGLRLGADDYLTKRIGLEHLLARVAALFRRVEALTADASDAKLIERGELVLDTDRLSAKWRGRAVVLTVTEFWIVHALAVHPGHVRTRDIANKTRTCKVCRDGSRLRCDSNGLRHGIPMERLIRVRVLEIDADFNDYI